MTTNFPFAGQGQNLIAAIVPRYAGAMADMIT